MGTSTLSQSNFKGPAQEVFVIPQSCGMVWPHTQVEGQSLQSSAQGMQNTSCALRDLTAGGDDDTVSASWVGGVLQGECVMNGRGMHGEGYAGWLNGCNNMKRYRNQGVNPPVSSDGDGDQ